MLTVKSCARVIVHYGEDDPQCISDYHRVEVFLNGKKVVEYADAYHDRGMDKVKGFLDALRLYEPELDIITEDIADEVV